MTSSEHEKQEKLLIETFNRLSSSYRNKFTSDPTEGVKIQSMVDLWNIEKGSRVLEVGGGTGDLSPYLMEKLGIDGRLVFLDISPEMVEKAKEKLHEYKNIQFFCADISDFSTACAFDNIIVFNAFPHFIDKKKALSNIHRLLKPDGTLIISHNSSRWSIVGHHKRKKIDSLVSEFPEDAVVFNMLNDTGYNVQIFENNEGYDYYLVIAKKAFSSA